MRRSSRRSGEPPVVVGEVGGGSALTIKLHGQRLAELRKAMEARMRSGRSDGGTDSEEELSVRKKKFKKKTKNRKKSSNPQHSPSPAPEKKRKPPEHSQVQIYSSPEGKKSSPPYLPILSLTPSPPARVRMWRCCSA